MIGQKKTNTTQYTVTVTSSAMTYRNCEM